MPKKPTTNAKTKQVVTRLPIQMARQVEMLAAQNSVTTTAVITKLIAVGLGRLPPDVAKRMDDEIARRELQKRESDGTEAEVILSKWARF